MWGVDEPEGNAVREQADRHLRAAQEPLETGLGAGLPAMVLGSVSAASSRLSPSLTFWISMSHFASAPAVLENSPDGVRRAERLVVLGERDFEGIRERLPLRSSRSGPPVPSRERASRNAAKSRIAG